MWDQEKGENVWYEGVVMEVLDDDEYDEDCDFTVSYEGYEDTYEVKLVQEWNSGCVVIKGKADGPSLKKIKV